MNVILTSFKTSNSLVVRRVRWENYHQPNLSPNLVSFVESHSFFFFVQTFIKFILHVGLPRWH